MASLLPVKQGVGRQRWSARFIQRGFCRSDNRLPIRRVGRQRRYVFVPLVRRVSSLDRLATDHVVIGKHRKAVLFWRVFIISEDAINIPA